MSGTRSNNIYTASQLVNPPDRAYRPVFRTKACQGSGKTKAKPTREAAIRLERRLTFIGLYCGMDFPKPYGL